MAEPARLPRRRLLQLAGALPFGALLAACGGSPGSPLLSAPDAAPQEPSVTPTQEPPFIVAAGEERRLLMAGTPQETELFIFGSGQPGPVLAVLGGVHGNEPGGWQAAEQLRDEFRPAAGAFLIVPRANILATQQFVRTTDDLGDLNRLYPGDADGQPMARMAKEIVDTLREFRVSVTIDMHESWAFYTDRTDTQTGTAFLGQTVSSSTAQGLSLGRTVVDAVNQRARAPHEAMILREFPPPGSTLPVATPDADPTGIPSTGQPFGGRSRSSLGLSTHILGSIALLVEMGQQQQLSRRVALHVDIVNEVARQIGI